jgi:hypothetical protein
VTRDRGDAAAVQPPAHVDDRDVEVADVTQPLEAFLATLGFEDVEPVLQDFADPESDERVPVDDKAVWTIAQDCFRSEDYGSVGHRVLGASLDRS